MPHVRTPLLFASRSLVISSSFLVRVHVYESYICISREVLLPVTVNRSARLQLVDYFETIPSLWIT